MATAPTINSCGAVASGQTLEDGPGLYGCEIYPPPAAVTPTGSTHDGGLTAGIGVKASCGHLRQLAARTAWFWGFAAFRHQWAKRNPGECRRNWLAQHQGVDGAPALGQCDKRIDFHAGDVVLVDCSEH